MGDRRGCGGNGQGEVGSRDRDVADVGGEGSGEEQDEPDRGGDPERPQAEQPEREPGRPCPAEELESVRLRYDVADRFACGSERD